LSLEFIFWATCVAALISFWWHSDRIKAIALQKIAHACRQQGLQLLDQTMVLSGLWPARDAEGKLTLRRRYRFEFSSTGSKRYSGELTLIGSQIDTLELDPHILPEDEQPQRFN
jgi:hypothetical protein